MARAGGTVRAADPAAAAEAAGAGLPPLLIEAERVAATVAQGVHGRRRVGQGDSFWQFRPFQAGDASARIDWRRTARSDRATVREMEWEAAQTAVLWRDASASMDWRSGEGLPTKRQRAELVLLGLAALLLRAGETVRLAGGEAVRGRAGLARLAASLEEEARGPEAASVPRHAAAVLIGDFLAPPEETGALLRGLAERRARAVLVQVLDPAELDLPYAGRVRFRGLEGEAPALLPRVEGVREAYGRAMAAQRAALARACEAAQAAFLTHRTDEAPARVLTALHLALGGA